MANALPLAFFSMPGGYEWIIIGLIALLLFGKRLPGVAKSLGQAMHDFKAGLNGTIDADEAKAKKDADTARNTAETASPKTPDDTEKPS
ncbi:MAG: twin-arginine translocase TatA/TatE family subunit [Planctomycetes bacterium]|nr:twin-arginine translocase TatA/TatE family subunit [Planctomycetota bacterium]